MGTGSFPGVSCGRDVTLTPHHILVPRSKIEYSYTSTLPKGLCGLLKGETYLPIRTYIYIYILLFLIPKEIKFNFKMCLKELGC